MTCHDAQQRLRVVTVAVEEVVIASRHGEVFEQQPGRIEPCRTRISFGSQCIPVGGHDGSQRKAVDAVHQERRGVRLAAA